MDLILPPGANKLGAVFDKKSAAHKFLWAWALVKEIGVRPESEDIKIPEERLYQQMIALAFPIVARFHLSLAPMADSISKAVTYVEETLFSESLSAPETSWMEVSTRLTTASREILKEHYAGLKRYVRFKFLYPWFGTGEDSEIRTKANADRGATAPYWFGPEETLCIATWFSRYVQQHQRIIEGWILWKMAGYLSEKNPMALNIPAKLAAAYDLDPEPRDTQQGRLFWETTRRLNNGFLPCFYSSKELLPGNYDIDHFIPWDFLGHNRLWNLIPSTSVINRSKSDQIPRMDTFLDSYVRRHIQALESLVKNRFDVSLRHDLDTHNYVAGYGFTTEGEPDNIMMLVEKGDSPAAEIRLREELEYLAKLALRQGFRSWDYAAEAS